MSKNNDTTQLASELANHFKVRAGKKDLALDAHGVSVYQKALEGLSPRAREMMGDPTKREESRIIEGAIQKRAQECFGMKTKDGKVVLDPVKLKNPNNIKLFNNLVKTDLGERNFDKFLSKNQARAHVVNYSKSVMEAQGLKVDDKTKQKLADLADRMSKKFGPEYVEKNFNKVGFGIDQAVKDVKPNAKLSDKDLDKLLKKAEANINDSLTQQKALEDRGLRRPSMDAAPKISPEEAAKNKAKKAEADRVLTDTALELAADVAGRFNIKGKNLTMTKELYNLTRDLTERLGPDYVKENVADVAIALEKEISKKQSIFSRKTVTIPAKNDFADKVYSQHRAASARFQEQAAMEKAAPKKPLELYVPPKPVDTLPKAKPYTELTPPPLLSRIKDAIVTPVKAPDTDGLDTTPKPTMSYDDLVTTKPKTEKEAVQKLAQDIEDQFMFGQRDVLEKTKGQFKKIAEGVVKNLGTRYSSEKSLAIAKDVAKKVKDVRKVSDSQVKDIGKDVLAKHGAKQKEQQRSWEQYDKTQAQKALDSLTPEKRAEVAARAKAKFEAEKIGSGIKSSIAKPTAPTRTPTLLPNAKNQGKGGVSIS